MTRIGWITAALLLLAGCAGSPPNRYYTLAAESPCPSTSPSNSVGGLNLTTIRLPGVLDRPQIVVRNGPQTVDIREFDRWAEPLDQLSTRILAEDFTRCRSASGVGTLKYRLSVSADEFMADTSGQVLLSGRWWALQKGEEITTQPGHIFSLRQQVDKARDPEGVAAMSALLGRLAAEVVNRLSRPDGRGENEK